MSRRRLEQVACDVCGADNAMPFSVSTPDGSYTLDLCDEHAEPLERLAQKGVFTPAPPSGRKFVRLRHRVKAIDPALLPPEE